MVQVREKSGHISVLAAARIDLPSQSDPALTGAAPEGESSASHDAAVEALGQQIRAAFASGSFKGTRCVISLPREDVYLQSIRLPSMPDEELRQTALWEASQRFGLDRQAMQVDFIRTGATLAATSAESREEVILIAASHAAIHARVEPVMAAGLRPVAVEAGFCALARVFSRQSRRESDRDQVRCVVEVGQSGSTVLILRGDQIAFCKPIAIGGRHFNAAVADHLQVSEVQAADLRSARIAREHESKASEQADPATDRAVYEAVRPLMGDLVKEVMLCLRYYGVTFRGHAPDRIILSGGDGLEPRLGEVMASTCNAPVVFDDSLSTLASTLPAIRSAINRTTGPAACWGVPLGLSMRGLAQRGTLVKAPVETAVAPETSPSGSSLSRTAAPRGTVRRSAAA